MNIISNIINPHKVHISIILSIIFYADTIVSGTTVIKFNKSFKRYGEDNTNEVKSKIGINASKRRTMYVDIGLSGREREKG